MFQQTVFGYFASKFFVFEEDNIFSRFLLHIAKECCYIIIIIILSLYLLTKNLFLLRDKSTLY